MIKTVRKNARELAIAIEPGGEFAARLLFESVVNDDRDWRSLRDTASRLEPGAIGPLIEGLKDHDEDVRTTAAYALAELSEKLPTASDKPDEQKPEPSAVEAWSRGWKLRVQAANALIPVLKDADTQVRWAAAWGLYALSVDEAAVASLIKIADDRSTRVPQGASIRLTWYLDGGNGNRIERRAQNEYLRVGAIQALGGFGERAAPAVPVLIEALRTDDWLRQWYATEALAQIGPKAKAAVPELIARVRTKRDFPIPTGTTVRNEPMRTPYGLDIAAIKALGQIGPDARAAIPVLNDVLKGSDKAVRAEAAQALELIKSNPKAADPEQ